MVITTASVGGGSTGVPRIFLKGGGGAPQQKTPNPTQKLREEPNKKNFKK
mgnify:CR=1 FL=1